MKFVIVFPLNNVMMSMRLNIGHPQCTMRRDNVDGNFFFFCSKLLFEDDVYLCLKSTVNCKSIYKKNYIKVIIMIVSTSSSFLLRRFVVNAISKDISHEIPRVKSKDSRKLFQAQATSEVWKKIITFYYFSWLFEFSVNWMMSLEKVKRSFF